jgi:hypothetical protein
VSKKRLDTTAIVNELEHSSFFRSPQQGEPQQPASEKASITASALASPPTTDPIETIRKSVKQIGKEVSFVRLTPDEKRQLKDIVYTYQRRA